MISARRLQKRFGTLEVLREVSLEVQAGEVVVIIGPSGSGKSTLLRCLIGLEAPESGEIRWAMRNLVKRKIESPAF